jgi:hypothetical protein
LMGRAGSMDRDGVLRLLDERQAACRAQADRLREEAERIAGLLEACRLELDRVATAREVVASLSAVTDPGQRRATASTVDDELREFSDRALEVLAERGTPMRCRELAEAFGDDAGAARNVERVRHRMKRLVRAGRVTEPVPGVFALPGAGSTSTG